MSVRLVDPQDVYQCSMCPTTRVGMSWRSLAANGWTCNPAGEHEPIRLCTACAEIIANRRGAAFESSV